MNLPGHRVASTRDLRAQRNKPELEGFPVAPRDLAACAVIPSGQDELYGCRVPSSNRTGYEM